MGSRRGWAMTSRILLIAVLAAGLAACTSKPDLRFEAFSIEPATAEPGLPVTIRATVINRGKGEAVDRYKRPIPAGVDFHLFDHPNDVVPAFGSALAAFTLPDDYALGPGEVKNHRSYFEAPPGFAAGAYFVCGDIDREKEVEEERERNNRACLSLMMTDPPATRADLVIESANFLGTEKASAKVLLKVRNVGEREAAPFLVTAIQRNPRTSALLTNVALSEGQRVSGSVPPNSAVGTIAPLGHGAAIELKAYVTFLFAGSTMPTNPANGAPTTPAAKERLIDFTVDGCEAQNQNAPMPRWCRVNELDELNNFFAVKVKAP